MDEKRFLRAMRLDGIIGAIGFLVYFIKPILVGVIQNETFYKIYDYSSYAILISLLIAIVIQSRVFKNHLSDEREFETASYVAMNTIKILIYGLIFCGIFFSIVLRVVKITIPWDEISSIFDALMFAIVSIFSFSFLYYTEDPEDLDETEGE